MKNNSLKYKHRDMEVCLINTDTTITLIIKKNKIRIIDIYIYKVYIYVLLGIIFLTLLPYFIKSLTF